MQFNYINVPYTGRVQPSKPTLLIIRLDCHTVVKLHTNKIMTQQITTLP